MTVARKSFGSTEEEEEEEEERKAVVRSKQVRPGPVSRQQNTAWNTSIYVEKTGNKRRSASHVTVYGDLRVLSRTAAHLYCTDCLCLDAQRLPLAK